MYNKKARDDPKCPSEFKFDPLQISKEEGSEPKTDDKILCSRLVLEIAHLLFCRQWKLICHSSLPYQKRFVFQAPVLVPSIADFTQGLLELLWTVYSEGKLQSCIKFKKNQNSFI